MGWCREGVGCSSSGLVEGKLSLARRGFRAVGGIYHALRPDCCSSMASVQGNWTDAREAAIVQASAWNATNLCPWKTSTTSGAH